MGCPTRCIDCGQAGVQANIGFRCTACADRFLVRPDDVEDDSNEPIGSCDECGCNLYADDEWDGLCNQCAWLSQQGW